MAEYLQGTVVRIDRDRGEIAITLSENGQCRYGKGNEAAMKESSTSMAKQRQIIVKAAWFPRCLATGAQVYVRGEYAADRPDFFEAEDVFPCRGRGDHDPTGVRSRFRHHRRQMMEQMGGEMHE